MASTSETGHPKNVANFENLVSFCVGYGVTFNPSKINLKIPGLQTQLASCKLNIASVTSTSVAFNNAVNARMDAFFGLRKLSTRLLNALDAVATSMTSASAVGAGPVTQLNATGPVLKSTVKSLRTQFKLFKSKKVFVE